MDSISSRHHRQMHHLITIRETRGLFVGIRH